MSVQQNVLDQSLSHSEMQFFCQIAKGDNGGCHDTQHNDIQHSDTQHTTLCV
jgi:hypothetical protein